MTVHTSIHLNADEQVQVWSNELCAWVAFGAPFTARLFGEGDTQESLQHLADIGRSITQQAEEMLAALVAEQEAPDPLEGMAPDPCGGGDQPDSEDGYVPTGDEQDEAVEG